MNHVQEEKIQEEEIMNKMTKPDLNTIDNILDYKPSNLDYEKDSFDSFVGFNTNFSGVVDSINKLKHDLNEKNFLKEISDVVISEETIKVPFLGWFGKTFGIYKEVNQETEETIVTKLGLEEAMPRIVDRMTDLSSSLGSVTDKLRDVIRSRNKQISRMESEVLNYIKSYNQMKLSCDELEGILEQSRVQINSLDDYLMDSNYKDDSFSEYEVKRTSLNKQTIELKKDYVVLKKVVHDKEDLKRKIEHSMCKAIEENQGLELYARTANYVRKLVNQQNRESTMSLSAVYTLAAQMKEIAYIGGEMIKQNKLNLELTESLRHLSQGFEDDSEENISGLSRKAFYEKIKGLF